MNDWDTETAEWYADNYGEYATNRLGVEALNIDANSTVVDIGCGTGCALRHASEQVTSGTLIGIDPVPRMIEIAREKTAGHSAVNRIFYHEGKAEKLPIEDSTVDVVLAFDSYDHWQDKFLGLKEVHRVLKSHGCFVVIKDGGLPNGTDKRTELVAALEEAGFKVAIERSIEDNDVSFTQWECLVRK